MNRRSPRIDLSFSLFTSLCLSTCSTSFASHGTRERRRRTREREDALFISACSYRHKRGEYCIHKSRLRPPPAFLDQVSPACCCYCCCCRRRRRPGPRQWLATLVALGATDDPVYIDSSLGARYLAYSNSNDPPSVSLHLAAFTFPFLLLHPQPTRHLVLSPSLDSKQPRAAEINAASSTILSLVPSGSLPEIVLPCCKRLTLRPLCPFRGSFENFHSPERTY